MIRSNGFKRVVLATDASDEAYAAVDATIALVRDSHSSAEVRVVHAWNLEVHHPHGHWDIEVRSEAEKLVSATVERLKAAGVRSDSEMLRADSEHVADALIPAGTSDVAERWMLGTVEEKVGRRSGSPVLVAPPTDSARTGRGER